MFKALAPIVIATVGLAACTAPTAQLGPDGKPLNRIYRVSKLNQGKVQFRMLDSVNVLRQSRGLASLELNAELNAAAATHARDMSIQNRPWHFGSDGSSPLDRATRAGYQQVLLGENISETYETELETLAAWMEQPDTRDVILAPGGADLGFSWHQDPNGKIWWTLLVGGAPA